MTVLDIGAGTSPHPDADTTLDIREDLEHIDHPGVDVSKDPIPLDTDSCDRVILQHIFEHIPPTNVSHVLHELDRITSPGGEIYIETPHPGTFEANTDPTHVGNGGLTPGFSKYFDGTYEDYWELDWDVNAIAVIEFPTFLRKNLRINVKTSDGRLSTHLLRIPGVSAHTEIKIIV